MPSTLVFKLRHMEVFHAVMLTGSISGVATLGLLPRLVE